MDLIVRGSDAQWGDRVFPCVVGKGGFTHHKVEGDGATPYGIFPFRRIFYRPDRVDPPHTSIPLDALTPGDGWCDDVTSPHYNRFLSLPFDGSHEKLWRKDHLYDLILVVGHNDDPPIVGQGSAIFVHLMRPQKTPTLGCVAFEAPHLLYILETCDTSSRLIVEPL